MKKILLAFGLFLVSQNLLCQDNYNLIVKSGTELRDVLDILFFEEMNYKKIIITGDDLKEKYYIITATEYWDKKILNSDTIINTKQFGLKNNSKELEFRVVSKKTSEDSVKFTLFQPRLTTVKKFKTKNENNYSLRDPSNGKKVEFGLKEKVATLSYSLPYKDPSKPDQLFYCILSSDGTPPKEWGKKYGVPHYIIFEFEIIE